MIGLGGICLVNQKYPGYRRQRGGLVFRGLASRDEQAVAAVQTDLMIGERDFQLPLDQLADVSAPAPALFDEFPAELHEPEPEWAGLHGPFTEADGRCCPGRGIEIDAFAHIPMTCDGRPV